MSKDYFITGCIVMLVFAAFTQSHLVSADWSAPVVIDQRDGDFWASITLDKRGDLQVAYLHENGMD
ncbi:hypothetical protein J7M28_12885, partial [bacterium]|nr:hypothetical protein [bacterium]